MNITFLDSQCLNPGDLTWEGLERLGHFRSYPRTAPEDVVERAKDSEIIITNKVHFGEEELAQLPNLKCICVAATGYDCVDVKACRKYGVPVCNCAGYSTEAVAQHIFALMLESTNHVGRYAQETHDGVWSDCPDFCYCTYPIRELAGQQLAIVGFGNIGQAVAKRALAFGMKVAAVTSKATLPEGVTAISMEKAFETSDFVALCLPATPENKGFVNENLLKNCKPTLTLINTARGALVNDYDVSNALKTNKLGTYCADVMCPEPPQQNNPLLTAPNCFITPHVAWAAVEARQRLLKQLEENVEGYLNGNLRNVVN